jgi:hypothetical protein
MEQKGNGVQSRVNRGLAFHRLTRAAASPRAMLAAIIAVTGALSALMTWPSLH